MPYLCFPSPPSPEFDLAPSVFIASARVSCAFGDNDPRNISFPLKETKKFKVTNQVAELTACVKGIETLIGSQKTLARKIFIYTDSMYIVNSISSWAKNWEKNEWKKSDGRRIENLYLMQIKEKA